MLVNNLNELESIKKSYKRHKIEHWGFTIIWGLILMAASYFYFSGKVSQFSSGFVFILWVISGYFKGMGDELYYDNANNKKTLIELIDLRLTFEKEKGEIKNDSY